MPTQVLMICQQEMCCNDMNLLKIISFFGLQSQVIHLDDRASTLNRLHAHGNEDDVCAVINCAALSRMRKKTSLDELKGFFFSRKTSMLIYDICPGEETVQTIRWLCGARLRSVHHPSGNTLKYSVSDENIFITRHFHGLSFGPVRSECDFFFDAAHDNEDIVSLISIDNHPFFIKYREKRCDVFLVANNRIIDIDMKDDDPKCTLRYFSQLIPEAMFLRYVFGDKCWHSQQVYANLIIDDPLLKKKYGFLSYQEMLEEIDKYNICASIAFIPFNYRRSERNTAKLFADRQDRLSICFHGSQHTYAEFGIQGLGELNSKISLATIRMEEHARLTGVPYDKIMVFPQGIFTVNAMKILKQYQFLAAVNTEAVPYRSNNQSTISALLEPAIMTYEQFPLFQRRYPESIEDLAFDSFFGKPLLIVEHHTYFRHGYQNLAKLTSRLKTIDSSIHWDVLGNIIKRSYLMRDRCDGDIDVKIYANPTLITNASNRERTYHIRKAETDHAAIREIRIVGGEIISSDKNTGDMYVVARIQPHSCAELRIDYANKCSRIIRGPGEMDSAKVVLRRYLSEIRDNYLSKSPFFSSVVYAGLRGLSLIRVMNQGK